MIQKQIQAPLSFPVWILESVTMKRRESLQGSQIHSSTSMTGVIWGLGILQDFSPQSNASFFFSLFNPKGSFLWLILKIFMAHAHAWVGF